MHGAWRTRGTWGALRWWWALLPWTLVRVALQQLPQTAGLAFGLTLLFTSGVTVHGLILGVTGLVFIITRHFVLGYVGLRRNERQSVSEGEFTGFFLLVHAVQSLEHLSKPLLPVDLGCVWVSALTLISSLSASILDSEQVLSGSRNVTTTIRLGISVLVFFL